MTPGMFHADFFPDVFFQEDFFPEYGATLPTTTNYHQGWNSMSLGLKMMVFQILGGYECL